MGVDRLDDTEMERLGAGLKAKADGRGVTASPRPGLWSPSPLTSCAAAGQWRWWDRFQGRPLHTLLDPSTLADQGPVLDVLVSVCRSLAATFVKG